MPRKRKKKRRKKRRRRRRAHSKLAKKTISKLLKMLLATIPPVSKKLSKLWKGRSSITRSHNAIMIISISSPSIRKSKRSITKDKLCPYGDSIMKNKGKSM